MMGMQVVFDEVAGRPADEQFVLGEAGVEMEKVEALEFEAHDRTCRSASNFKTGKGSRKDREQGTGNREQGIGI